MLDLPPELGVAVQEGRAVLFLGAGASQGAKDTKNDPIPDGRGLAEILIQEYLGKDYAGLDFRSAYDLACSERDVRTVQRKIFDVLNPFQPAAFHLLIPTFAWAGIAGTNYDLIVERAYQRAPSPLQTVVPNVKDGDGATDQLGDRSVLYVKLHGCITRHQDVTPPLVASTEQLIAFRDGRNGQFGTFLEWAKTKTLIFCGYAFLDSNLRILFDEIIKEGDNRPRHYIISKGIRPAEIGYWRDRRVVGIDTTFQAFLETLDHQLSKHSRALGTLAVDALNRTTFSRFITAPNSRETDELKYYLSSFIEHIGPHIDPPLGDPKRFYSGFDLGWFPIVAQLDIRQPVVDEILTDQILAPSQSKERQSLVIIKGHAGSGKTIALRRLCFETATRHERLCFFVSRQHLIQVDRFEEIFQLTNFPIFLFVDNVAEHRDRILHLLALARRLRAQIKIIGTETFNTWNVSCDDLEPFVSSAAEMRYLSETNIKILIGKLEEHKSLGYLERLSNEDRIHELQYVHGRQLLVALLEATHGVPLTDIISEEYNSICPAEAKLLYLDICSLHRFGPPVRAGLISRIHNIAFDDFRAKLFRPLEAIVVLRIDKRSGDYVYEARHSYIANTVYERILTSGEERFDNISRIITKLNPSFSYDLEVIGKLLRADNLENALSDHAKIRQIYDTAEISLGSRAVIFHQRGIFEMHVAVNLGALNVAQDLLEKAQTLEPFNRSIRHSMAEIDLRRSRLASDPLERLAWRRSAVERANALASRGDNAYPYHTLLKAAIDAVKDELAATETKDDEAITFRLDESVANAEAVLRKGLQAFPNEAVLLAEEGELSRVLSQSPRAEAAFEKAFAANPRSTLIARRLARIKRSKSAFAEAQQVLQKCLEYNPGAQDLHYDFAMSIIESAPDADQAESDAILYHLRRSFSQGDKNRQAQFWYARELSITGRYDEARPLFKTLSEAHIPFKDKIEVRGILQTAEGKPRELVGTVALLRETFGFVQCDAMHLSAFFSTHDDNQESLEYLIPGGTVRFELGFSLRGPVVSRFNS